MTNRIGEYLVLLGVFFVFSIIDVFVETSIAGMYKWVDQNGVVHVSDTPPQHADNAKIEKLPTYQTDKKVPEETKDTRTITPYVVQQKPSLKERKVELYTTSWCPWCKKAKAFFQAKGIPFIEYDIEKDKEAARRKERIDTQKGVPFAVIDGRGVHGYSEEAYNKALNR